jgi:hypothetical protein
MEHFPDHVWADFIRDTGTSESMDGLKAHLANGCAHCASEGDFWSRLRMCAENEASYAVPQDIVHMLKLEFASQHSQNSQESKVAHLVFDSFAQPLLSGVRAGLSAARQLVYEADGLTVDMRLEKGFQASKVCAVGQVLDQRARQVSAPTGSVILWTDRGLPVLQTAANEHGEFAFEFVNKDNLRLSIELQGRSPVRINLPELK